MCLLMEVHTTSYEVSEKLNLIPAKPLDLIASPQERKGTAESILNDNIWMPIAKPMWDFEKCQNVENSTGQMTQFLQHINCNLERTHISQETPRHNQLHCLALIWNPV